jgi:hypothetical protein
LVTAPANEEVSMTNTREMLEALPFDVPLDVGDVANAIDASLSCLQACRSCADGDLGEDDLGDLRRCIALDQRCADICDVTARVLSQPGEWDEVVVHGLLQACVRASTACAEECARHAAHHRHCAICEKACRACVAACSALLEDEAFQQLQKLAGA